MTSKWPNRSFLPSSSKKNADFDNHPWNGVSLWKARSPVQKFQHTTGGKKSETGGTEESKSNGFALLASPLPWGGTAQCQEKTFGPWFLLGRKEGTCEWVVLDTASFSLYPENGSILHDQGQGMAERTAAKTFRVYQRDMDLTNHITDSIRKPTH